MGLKRKEKKKIRASIIHGLQLQEIARQEYKEEVERLEQMHKERLKLAYDVFNNTMTDTGYSLAYIEMKWTKDKYPELWV